MKAKLVPSALQNHRDTLLKALAKAVHPIREERGLRHVSLQEIELAVAPQQPTNQNDSTFAIDTILNDGYRIRRLRFGIEDSYGPEDIERLKESLQKDFPNVKVEVETEVPISENTWVYFKPDGITAWPTDFLECCEELPPDGYPDPWYLCNPDKNCKQVNGPIPKPKVEWVIKKYSNDNHFVPLDSDIEE